MSLKWKLALLSFGIAAFVSTLSLWVFGRAWRDLARAYALTATDTKVRNFEALRATPDSDEWILDQTEWISPPAGVEPATFARAVAEAVAERHQPSGSFESLLPHADGKPRAHLLSFRTDPLRVVGVESELHPSYFRIWAAPFLGTVVLGLAIALAIGFWISARLNGTYLRLERALGNIGAGRFERLELPPSGDPALRRLARTLRRTARLLEEREGQLQTVAKVANEDATTGLPNYRAFGDFLTGLASGVVSAEMSPVLAVIALDQLDEIRETHGNAVGDFVLRESARLIRDCIRMSSRDESQLPDFFGRYGGEKFVVIFANVRGDAAQIAPLRILRALRSATLNVAAEVSATSRASELRISASIGLAPWDREQGFRRETWVKAAEAALGEAQRSGCGKVVQLQPERKEWT